MVQWNAAKTKVQLRLGVQRLRMLQEKKSAQAKSARRDIATLIERGRTETAYIKVESIINEDIYIELLELLELYCELLIARFNFLDIGGKEPDPGIHEAVCCLIYAAPRTELKELHILREMLMHKFGRDFSLGVMENRNNCVSDRVLRKIAIAAPDSALIDAYVEEIAKGYGVEYTPPPRYSKKSDEGDATAGGGDQPEEQQATSSSSGGPNSETKPQKTEPTEEEVQSKLDINVTASKLPTVPGTVGSKDSSPQPPPYMPSAKPLKPSLKKSDPPATTSAAATTSPSNEAEKQSPPPEDDFVSLTQRLAALKRR